MKAILLVFAVACAGYGTSTANCTFGYYQDTTGSQISCTPCPPGTWGGAGSTNSSCWGVCRAGYTCPAGSTAEMPCPAGTANPASAAASGSACMPCGRGAASSAGAAACTQCPLWTLSNATACSPCPLNTYCDGAASLACVADGRCAVTGCAPGYSGVLCSACAGGYFASTTVTVTAGSQTCQPCPNNLAETVAKMVGALLVLLIIPGLIYVHWVERLERVKCLRHRRRACMELLAVFKGIQKATQKGIAEAARTGLSFYIIESHISCLILLNNVSSVPFPDFFRFWLLQPASAFGFNLDVAHPECINASWSLLNTWEFTVLGSVAMTLGLMFIVGVPLDEDEGSDNDISSGAVATGSGGAVQSKAQPASTSRHGLSVVTNLWHTPGRRHTIFSDKVMVMSIHKLPLTPSHKGKAFVIAYVLDAKGISCSSKGYLALGASSCEPGTSFIYNGATPEADDTGFVRFLDPPPPPPQPVLHMLRHFCFSVLLLRPEQFADGNLWWAVWQFFLKQMMQRSLKVMSYTTVGGIAYLSYDPSLKWWHGNPAHQAVLLCAAAVVALSTFTVLLEVLHSRFWQRSSARCSMVDPLCGENIFQLKEPTPLSPSAQELTPLNEPLTATQRLKARLEVIGNVFKWGSAWAILYGPFGHLSASIHLIIFSILELAGVLLILGYNPDTAKADSASAGAVNEAEADFESQYFAKEVRTFLAAITITTLTVLLGLVCAISEAVRMSNAVSWVFLLLNAVFFVWCVLRMWRTRFCYPSEAEIRRAQNLGVLAGSAKRVEQVASPARPGIVADTQTLAAAGSSNLVLRTSTLAGSDSQHPQASTTKLQGFALSVAAPLHISIPLDVAESNSSAAAENEQVAAAEKEVAAAMAMVEEFAKAICEPPRYHGHL